MGVDQDSDIIKGVASNTKSFRKLNTTQWYIIFLWLMSYFKTKCFFCNLFLTNTQLGIFYISQNDFQPPSVTESEHATYKN